MEFKEYVIGEFDTEEQKKFRKEVGEWLDKNITPEFVKVTNELRVTGRFPGQQEFAVKLGTKGWLVSRVAQRIRGSRTAGRIPKYRFRRD